MDVQNDSDATLVRRCAEWCRVPRCANLNGLYIAVNTQRACVGVAPGGLNANEALLFTARREGRWCSGLNLCQVVHETEHDVRHNRLSVAPFRVLATMAREKLDEEEGEARQLVAQGYEDVDAIKRGRIDESHSVANIKERGMRTLFAGY
jgi:hypothetical protein